jgi:hypothetical protein
MNHRLFSRLQPASPGVLGRRSLLLLIPCLIVAGALHGQEPPKADALPPGVEAFGGHHYLLVDEVEDLSWDVAKKQCEDWGAHLVVVTQADEAAFIAKLCDKRYMYLGASDAAEEGVWAWVDGSEWDFTHWYKGQPNDYAGGENYLATYDRGEWVDVDGSGDEFWMPTGYICEWDR